jgi:hypothetical protein
MSGVPSPLMSMISEAMPNADRSIVLDMRVSNESVKKPNPSLTRRRSFRSQAVGSVMFVSVSS